jgi:two-component system chemotaxis response regulator CheB
VIRVFVVDDSTFVRRAIARILAATDDVIVCGEAATGREALARIDVMQPDLVTLDIDMPDMNGVSVLRELLARDAGTRVIMVSAHTAASADLTMEALAMGALDFVDKQRFNVLDVDGLAAEMLAKIRLFGERRRKRATPLPSSEATTSPVRRKRAASAAPTAPAATAAPAAPPRPVRKTGPEPAILSKIDWSRYDVCCVGASTGGPPAIERLLRALRDDFPLPLAIVQHMPAGFTRSFAERLDRGCRIHVAEAQGVERLRPGMALVARAGEHMVLGKDLAVLLVPDTAGRHVPSVDVLLESAAAVCGPRVVGVLLTGMGEDGAAGMAAVRAAGGLTIGENEASCVVYGMPRAAHVRGGVEYQLPLSELCKVFAG